MDHYYCKVSRHKDDFFQKLFIYFMALLLTFVHCFAKFIKYFCCLAVSITLILLADIWTMKSCKPSLEKGQNPSIEKLS